MVLEQVVTVADFLDRAAKICDDKEQYPQLPYMCGQTLLDALTEASYEGWFPHQLAPQDEKHHRRVSLMMIEGQKFVKSVTGWKNIPENSRNMSRSDASKILREAAELAAKEGESAAA